MKLNWTTYKSEVPTPCPRCRAAGVVRNLLTGRRVLCPRCGGGKRVLIEVVEQVEVNHAA